MCAETEATTHEDAFVNAFIRKDYCDRLLFEVRKRRNHFKRRFSDAMRYLDPRFAIAIPRPNSDPSLILQLLNSKGAGPACYAISMSGDIDGRVLPLVDALDVAVGFGLPTILSCHAGQLAYLETEQVAGPPDRYILFRPPSSHR